MGVNFYPRPPRGGRPLPFRAYAKVWNISIHALREEGDRGLLFQHRPCNDFYPRPPRGGRQQHECHRRRSGGFLSTPSARRATWCGGCDITPMTISIHALREEGDVVRHHADFIRYDFYPRPPRGGRLRLRNHAGGNHEFLSTPSARRATSYASRGRCMRFYFYPRPPRGGRRSYWIPDFGYRSISIHALREEGDACRRYRHRRADDFYPRPPRGGRLLLQEDMVLFNNFYPRPPRGGRPFAKDIETEQINFYPRPPRGGRPDLQRRLRGRK